MNLVLGFDRHDLPFAGGVMVPALDFLFTGLRTGPSGRLDLGAAWPSGVPSGTDLYFQHWLLDPAGPRGFAVSNAVGAVVR